MRFSVIVMPLLAALALAAPAPVDAEARQIDKRTLDDALADIDLALADLLALDVDVRSPCDIPQFWDLQLTPPF